MVDLYAAAERLLALVQEHFASAGVTLPETAYVAPGAVVAYDGEQVTVHCATLFPGQPPTASAPVVDPALTLQSAEFRVTVVRDTPVLDDDGNPPTTNMLLASAEEQMNDMKVMMQTLEDIRSGYELVQYGVPFSIVGVTPYGPEGGVVGTIGTVQVLLLEPSMVWS